MDTMSEKMGSTDMIDVSKADTQGVWELLPCDSQILAVHAALLHTGKVIFISGSGNNTDNFNAHLFRSVVWDYENGTSYMLSTPTDIFCSGHSILPDGRLVVGGGTLQYDPFRGTPDTYILDPSIKDFIHVQSMVDGRWYPTLVTLGDGRILAISGLSATLDPAGNSKINQISEIYSNSNGWQRLTGNGPLWPLYPHAFLMRDGRLFYSGGHVFGSNNLKPGFFDISTNSLNALPDSSIPGDFNLNKRDQSASVLLPPAQEQKVMLMGGGDETTTGTPSNKFVHIIDLSVANPSYFAAAQMNYPRMHLNAVLLPDRTVFVSGGNSRGEDRTSAVLQSEIYHPFSNTWTEAATATVSRLYHSVALLLPDGRVLAAGSNPDRKDDELRLELFHPPYFFKGPRPFIQSVPQQWTYGETIKIHTPYAQEIKWVNLIRPMATTHSWDSNQRLVDMGFKHDKVCQLTAFVPGEPNLVPPGWYMLFITNDKDVPSVARWVHVEKSKQ